MFKRGKGNTAAHDARRDLDLEHAVGAVTRSSSTRSWKGFAGGSTPTKCGERAWSRVICVRSLLTGYFGDRQKSGHRLAVVRLSGAAHYMRTSLTELTPDHSTILRARRPIDVETKREVFGSLLSLLPDRGLMRASGWGGCTTLEASAVMRLIVRRIREKVTKSS